MAAHNELGQWGENLATEYLRSKGYVIIDRDWHSGHRDLDIIAEDDDVVVFVEVKTRRNNIFGDPEEAIDFRKQRSLQLAINHYVKANRIRALTSSPSRARQKRNQTSGIFRMSHYYKKRPTVIGQAFFSS